MSKNTEVNLTTLEHFGVFSQPSYITIGDEYTQKTLVDDRYKGKQFVTNPPKKGKTKDVTLDKSFAPLFVGDRYVDSTTFERKAREAEKTKNVTSKPWVPSSPPCKPAGLGSIYGTFTKKVEHSPDPPAPKDTTKRAPAPKNFYTNPAKKGSYGTPGTLLQHKEFEHSVNDYDTKTQKKDAPVTPFKGMSHGGLIFDKNACYTVDQKVLKAKPPKTSESAKPVAVPFKPSSPAKSGKRGTINPFPEYKPEPYGDRSPSKPTTPTKVFKPSSASCKSGPTRSVVLYGLNSTARSLVPQPAPVAAPHNNTIA